MSSAKRDDEVASRDVDRHGQVEARVAPRPRLRQRLLEHGVRHLPHETALLRDRQELVR